MFIRISDTISSFERTLVNAGYMVWCTKLWLDLAINDAFYHTLRSPFRVAARIIYPVEEPRQLNF